MFDDFPFDLDPEDVAKSLRTQLSTETWINMSGADILNMVREAGFSIGTSAFYAVRRQVLGLYASQLPAFNLDPENPVPASYFYEEHGLSLSQDFLYRFRVTLTNQKTGETFEGIRSLATNRQSNIQDLMDLMTENLEYADEEYEFTVDDIVLTSALSRPGIFRQRS